MKLCTAFLLALCATFLPVKAISVFDHVSRVNSEWNNPVFSVDAFRNQRCDDALSERRLVQLHLQSVIHLLQSRSITGLSANQLQARANNIALLAGYAEAGSFPRNITHRGRIPVFVDDRNVPCAVGYLMLQSGYTDFVGETRTNVNNIYIRQIKSDVFTKFHAESGLTLDELALIQPGYGEYIEFEQIAPPEVIVNVFTSDTTRGLLYAYGTLGKFNSEELHNLATFNGLTWSAIPNKINGKVTCMEVMNGDLYVGGRFTMGNDSVFGLARYDGTSWQGFPANDEVTCLKADQYELYIGGKFTSIGGKSVQYFAEYAPIYKSWGSSARFNAPVNAITIHLGNVVVGGEFTKNRDEDHLFLSAWDGKKWLPLESPFNRPVTALHSGPGGDRYLSAYPVLYVGASRANGGDTAHHTLIAMKEFLTWKVLQEGGMGGGIEVGRSERDSVILVTGFEDFEFSEQKKGVIAKLQTSKYGHLMGMYRWFEAVGWNVLSQYRFGKTAPSAHFFKGNFYIGTDTNGLMKTNLIVLDVDENNSLTSELAVVGQSRESVTFRLPSEPHTQVSMSLVDILGVEVSREVVSTGDQLTLHTSHLSQGAYYARITADGKSYTKKLLVSY